MTELRVGDIVSAGGSGGRVTVVRGPKVAVELDDRPGTPFWFSAAEVRPGPPSPKSTFIAARFASRGRGVREEVRRVCAHYALADLCDECAGPRGRP